MYMYIIQIRIHVYIYIYYIYIYRERERARFIENTRCVSEVGGGGTCCGNFRCTSRQRRENEGAATAAHKPLKESLI